MKISISNTRLRKAIYEAYEGKCFYTGQPVAWGDMAIDHVIPKCEGGKDTIYNYVLTSRRLNSQKSARLDRDRVEAVLYIVRLVYARKVLSYLKRHGNSKARQDKRDKKQAQNKWTYDLFKAIGELFYSVLLENGKTSVLHIHKAQKASLETFGVSLPFYVETFLPYDPNLDYCGFRKTEKKRIDMAIESLSKHIQISTDALKKALVAKF